MSAHSGPNIVENGLILYLDSKNIKSINIPSKNNHGYADWYCFVSGTATYSIINSSGGEIYENNNGTVATLVSSSGPQRGTISVVAGRRYYGSVPINLIVENGHNFIAPLTMMSTEFMHYSNRGNPTTYYLYSPYSNATINFYDNTVGGLTGTPTSTHSINSGQSITITTNSLSYQWISSNVPVLATATQTGLDKTILSPMSQYVYQRFQQFLNTTNNTTPTNNNQYVTYDSQYNVMNMSIADGAGSDSNQGLGLEYLSDTYSWGNVVADYTIVFPYSNTVFTEYWDGTKWVVWDSHTVSNTSITNPVRIVRDGTVGPGVEGSTISGAATNMASSATLWRWSGTAPFYLAINDSLDDEFSVLGWMKDTIGDPKNTNIMKDISDNSNNLIMYGNISNNDDFTINFLDNSTLQYLMNSSFPNPTTTVTYSIWFKSRFTQQVQTPFTYSVNGNNEMLFFISNSTTISPHVKGSSQNFTVSDMTNRWINFVWTSNRATGDEKYYINGELVGSRNYLPGTLITSNGYLIIGQESDAPGGGFDGNQNLDGEFASMSVYNSILSESDVKQNFNALRGRFGV